MVDKARMLRGPVLLLIPLLLTLVVPGDADAGQNGQTTAGAAAPTPVVHRYALTTPQRDDLRVFGATDDPAKMLTIGSGTTQVVLDPGFADPGPEVHCSTTYGAPAIGSIDVSGAEWARHPTPTVSVAPGIVVAGSAGYFNYRCVTGTIETAQVLWQFWERHGAPATVTLPSDDGHLFEHDVTITYLESGPAQVVAPGDRVVLTGAPGSWPLRTEVALDVVLQRPGQTDVVLDNEDVSPDGAVVSFRIPPSVDPAILGPGTTMAAYSVDARIGPFSETEVTTTQWSAPLGSAAPAASTIAVALDHLVTVSVLKPRLAVTVRAEALPNSAGMVTVTIDGVDRVTKAITASRSTKVTVQLPRLARGVHTISARYGGAGNVAASMSGTLRLRVLI